MTNILKSSELREMRGRVRLRPRWRNTPKQQLVSLRRQDRVLAGCAWAAISSSKNNTPRLGNGHWVPL